jgi:hypothetical protein
MKFPISREQLHNIKKDVEEEIIHYNIEQIVENIKDRIIMHAYQGTPSHLGGITNTKLKIDISKFRIIIPDNLKMYIQINSSAHPLASFNPWKTDLDTIEGVLEELFPGVSFETDPLKTYMLIDWS